MTAETVRTIRVRAVRAPLPRPVTTAVATLSEAPLVLIDLETEHGVPGRAYLFAYTPLALRPLAAAVEAAAELVIGRPLAPHDRRRDLTAALRLLGRQGLMGMAMSGLDMALWDALARAHDQPVCALLGAAPQPVPVYASFGIWDPEADPEACAAAAAQGISAVKYRLGVAGLERDLADLAAIRQVIGAETRLMVDYNQALTPPEAIRRVNRFDAFDLAWVEEPVPAEDLAGHAAVRAAVSTPIQTGENWWGLEGAAQAIALGACDHAMPDLGKIGGVSGWRDAAGALQAAAIPISSHLYIEASAHVLAATPGAHLLEVLDIAAAVRSEPYLIEDGALTPRGPGLGLDWDEAAVSRFAA